MSKTTTPPAEAEEVKKKDVFFVPFTLFDIDEQSNGRISYPKIPELAEQIKAAGNTVIQAVVARKKPGGRYELIEGFRRYFATKMIYEESGGTINISIPVMIEPKGTTKGDRYMNMLMYNDGEPFTPLEKGNVIFRAISEEKMTKKQVAARLGISTVYVQSLLDLRDVSAEVKDLMFRNIVSATFVIKHQKAGDLDTVIENIKNSGCINDGVRMDDMFEPGRKSSSGSGKQSQVTEGDIKTNSVKEFKRFAKQFPHEEMLKGKANAGKLAAFEFAVKLINNEFTMDGIVNYFSDGK